MFLKQILLALSVCLFFACTPRTHIATVSPSYTKITDSLAGADPAVEALLKPYRDQMQTEMDEVVGHTLIQMGKARPESELTNLLADIMENRTEKLIGGNIDLAIINFGGIRLPVLPAGPITRGTIFELAPFDNKVLVLRLSAEQIQQLLDRIAGSGGWPVSQGLRMVIRDRKATQVTIDGRAIEAGRRYTVAMPDYVANGGDSFSFLAGLPREDTGHYLRDIFIDYFKEKESQGLPVTSITDKRITEER